MPSIPSPTFRVTAPTLRTLRPDAVAWIDPTFPIDRLWFPDTNPQLVVERGEDVVLEGELTLVSEDAALEADGLWFTGQRLAGTYETYWTTNATAHGLAILQAGAQPVGGVSSGSWPGVEAGTFTLTTRGGHEDPRAADPVADGRRTCTVRALPS